MDTSQGMIPLGLQEWWLKGQTKGGDPLHRIEMVMVQEDQDEGLGLLYYSLYTVDEGFQAPP